MVSGPGGLLWDPGSEGTVIGPYMITFFQARNISPQMSAPQWVEIFVCCVAAVSPVFGTY